MHIHRALYAAADTATGVEARLLKHAADAQCRASLNVDLPQCVHNLRLLGRAICGTGTGTGTGGAEPPAVAAAELDMRVLKPTHRFIWRFLWSPRCAHVPHLLHNHGLNFGSFISTDAGSTLRAWIAESTT